jgi:hypothetical protein
VIAWSWLVTRNSKITFEAGWVGSTQSSTASAQRSCPARRRDAALILNRRLIQQKIPVLTSQGRFRQFQLKSGCKRSSKIIVEDEDGFQLKFKDDY